MKCRHTHECNDSKLCVLHHYLICVFYKYTDLFATRRCLDSGVWSSTDVSICRSTEFIELEAEVLTQTNVNVTTLIMYTSVLSTITSTEQAILPQDVVTASSVLTEIIK